MELIPLQSIVCLDITAFHFSHSGNLRLLMLTGDYGRSVEYLLQILPAVEEQFGSNSIEVANELQKLSDVMIRDLSDQPLGSAAYL